MSGCFQRVVSILQHALSVAAVKEARVEMLCCHLKEHCRFRRDCTSREYCASLFVPTCKHTGFRKLNGRN